MYRCFPIAEIKMRNWNWDFKTLRLTRGQVFLQVDNNSGGNTLLNDYNTNLKSLKFQKKNKTSSPPPHKKTISSTFERKTFFHFFPSYFLIMEAPYMYRGKTILCFEFFKLSTIKSYCFPSVLNIFVILWGQSWSSCLPTCK